MKAREFWLIRNFNEDLIVCEGEVPVGIHVVEYSALEKAYELSRKAEGATELLRAQLEETRKINEQLVNLLRTGNALICGKINEEELWIRELDKALESYDKARGEK